MEKILVSVGKLLPTELNKEVQPVQVATLMTVIGEDGREVWSTFTDWAEEGDNQKIAPVLKKLGEYCEPHKSIPFERYRFNRRVQDPGETYDQFCTTLRKLAEVCNFEAINPEEYFVTACCLVFVTTRLGRDC